MARQQQVANWNGFPVVTAQIHTFRTVDELRKLVEETPSLIPRGSGLSYGDASLADHILSTLHFNKILKFNSQTGIIRCESGVTLDSLLKVVVPKGWFLPVTPGTKHITIGGAVAADVHGKNHHKDGAISLFVRQMKMMMANGKLITCSPTVEKDLFQNTFGGMGLTGVIVEVELKLRAIETSRICQTNIIAPNLKAMIGLLRIHHDTTYSVAWIDCLATGKQMGRGVVMLGEHAKLMDLPKADRLHPLKIHSEPKWSVPGFIPSFFLNPLSIKVFNQLFFTRHKLASKSSIVEYDTFFYPLDFVRGWNRLYGKKGFLQYQFVIPFEHGEAILAEIVNQISRSKLASFLAVLKLLKGNGDTMSFPLSGYTLSLDLPISGRLFPLLEILDIIVAKSGGRLYMAKDARMSSQMLAQGYPALPAFKKMRDSNGATAKFESLLSKRLKLNEHDED